MNPQHDLSSAITTELRSNVSLLGRLLGEVATEQWGKELLDLVETLRLSCKEASNTGDETPRKKAQELISTLDNDRIEWLMKTYTVFFHLVNKSEQHEIARINHERERRATAQEPRAESIAEAIHGLHSAGFTLDQVLSLIRRLDIQPTLTAHPTEARRRSILYKQLKVAQTLTLLEQPDLSHGERSDALDRIYEAITLLLATDEVRSERLTVEDEIQYGLYFCSTSIWQTVPELYADLADALKTYYGFEGDLPVVLRYRSWIGGDRDGNPNVTPQLTRQTIVEHMRTCLNLYTEALYTLRRELSISGNLPGIPQALYESIEHDREKFALPGKIERLYAEEPFRLKISYILLKINHLRDLINGEQLQQPAKASYNSDSFIADLELLHTCLLEMGLERVANGKLLSQLLWQARTFRFQMATLDIRQHSAVHEAAVGQLLSHAGVCESYATMEEADKIALLHAELQQRRPLLPRHFPTGPDLQQALDVFETIDWALQIEPEAVGCYIVSMTHDVSDLLEVMLLARETGLWDPGRPETARIDVVPLLETIEDLEAAEPLMTALFTDPVYRGYLKARGDFQEIMLGYSDSNKDGGYWMANWALHKTQKALGDVCRKHGLDFRLFHGRGGTVGRGGGRANKAILAMPDSSNNGRIRFTEQGEVISFRYAMPRIAKRHLEQIVNAQIKASRRSFEKYEMHSESIVSEPENGKWAMMDAMASTSMKAYRNFIDDPEFWPWYTSITPIEHISRLPIASRPVSRKTGQEVDFGSLRAIPWNFAWTQTRYNIPGWYGIGAAFGEHSVDASNTMKELYQTWPVFRAIVDNAQLEIARAKLDIASYYSGGKNPRLEKLVRDDFARATSAILEITGKDVILGTDPVIYRSIQLRNPYTDVLNLLQLELMERWKNRREEDTEFLRDLLFLSINGVAAAMQSTG